MNDYPSSVLPPPWNSVDVAPVDPVARTTFELGNVRSRRRTTNAPTQVTVSWYLTAVEMEIFDGWFHSTLLDGANWFDIDCLPLPGGVVPVQAKFLGMWKGQAGAGAMWPSVTATLNVRARPQLSAEELEVALAYSAEDLAAWSGSLHDLLETMADDYDGFYS